MRTTIHFEGLPGSGKTTATERLCGLLGESGVEASCLLEAVPDQPSMPREIRVLSCQRNCPQAHLDAWMTFLKSSSDTVVLDGYALQSTVRFLYANLVERVEIENYFKSWQELAPETMLVYFSVKNPDKHYEVVLAERGDEWASKLYTYVENTPIGLANGLQGKAGFVEFWSNYQRLCLVLLDAASIPVHLIDSRSWNDDDLKRLGVTAGLLPGRVRIASGALSRS